MWLGHCSRMMAKCYCTLNWMEEEEDEKVEFTEGMSVGRSVQIRKVCQRRATQRKSRIAAGQRPIRLYHLVVLLYSSCSLWSS